MSGAMSCSLHQAGSRCYFQKYKSGWGKREGKRREHFLWYKWMLSKQYAIFSGSVQSTESFIMSFLWHGLHISFYDQFGQSMQTFNTHARPNSSFEISFCSWNAFIQFKKNYCIPQNGRGGQFYNSWINFKKSTYPTSSNKIFCLCSQEIKHSSASTYSTVHT